MSVFFVDLISGKNSTYDDLFDYLNTETKVNVNYKKSDTIGFFKNLLLGIVYDFPLVILDLDFSGEEVERVLGEKYVPEFLTIPANRKFINKSNFSKVILDSNSKIILLTSGTTGIPKKVEHTIQSLTREIRIGDALKFLYI